MDNQRLCRSIPNKWTVDYPLLKSSAARVGLLLTMLPERMLARNSSLRGKGTLKRLYEILELKRLANKAADL